MIKRFKNFKTKTATVAATTLALAGLFVGSAHASTIDGIKVEPAQIVAGQTVKITVTGTEAEIPNCGLRIHFGDGTTSDFKLVKSGMIPLVIERKYEKAGEYKVMAEPKTVTTHPRCVGKNQNTVVKVSAPAPVAAAPAPAPVVAAAGATSAVKKPVGPSCPSGWKLDTKSINKKTGAFKCTGPANSKAPEVKLVCPGQLNYVENLKTGLLACQP